MVSSAVLYLHRGYSIYVSGTYNYAVSEVGGELITWTSFSTGNFRRKYVSYPTMSNPYDWIDYD